MPRSPVTPWGAEGACCVGRLREEWEPVVVVGVEGDREGAAVRSWAAERVQDDGLAQAEADRTGGNPYARCDPSYLEVGTCGVAHWSE